MSRLLILFLTFSIVHAQNNNYYETADYDFNGKRVIYYPEALMVSRNPKAIVFYANTKLLNLFVDLRTPSLGQDFAVNNTCNEKETIPLSK